jgi:hypothetical protein
MENKKWNKIVIFTNENWVDPERNRKSGSNKGLFVLRRIKMLLIIFIVCVINILYQRPSIIRKNDKRECLLTLSPPINYHG